jgi:DNA-binding CsgD family transcriptional regulator
MLVAVPANVTRRIASSLSLLVSPAAFPDAGAWRCAVTRDLRCLLSADAAVVAVEGDGPSAFHAIDLDAGVVCTYEDHYASVDVGIARQRSREIEVWCRRALWGAAELRRSEYYNDFARPNHLCDAVGISALARSRRTRVSLLYARVTSRPTLNARRLRLLELMLPAFRTGLALSTSTHELHDSMTNIIDCIDHPLALCDDVGRELHHNGALERAAKTCGGEELIGAIGHVTRAVAVARRTTPPGGIVSVNLALPHGEWRIRGSTLPWEGDRPSPTILISLARRNPVSSSTMTLRVRYSLTARETEVAELLRRRRSNGEIARALSISAHTARHHTESVLSKLGLQSRNQVEERLSAEERGQ